MLEEMKVGDLLKLLSCVKGDTGKSHSFVVGQKYFIRTVTHYYTGRLTSITDTDLVLDDAAWIADTGRFASMLTGKCELNEVEPFANPVIVARGSIVDATEWDHDLPRMQK